MKEQPRRIVKVEYLTGTLADLTVWFEDDPEQPFSIREFTPGTKTHDRLVILAAKIAAKIAVAVTEINR